MDFGNWGVCPPVTFRGGSGGGIGGLSEGPGLRFCMLTSSRVQVAGNGGGG